MLFILKILETQKTTQSGDNHIFYDAWIDGFFSPCYTPTQLVSLNLPLEIIFRRSL